MKLKLTRLDLSWSVSRGRDSYGYNIARLDDATSRKRYTTMGGGYDMAGTVFGDWLNDVYQARLVELFATRPTQDANYTAPGFRKITGLYGIVLSPKEIAYCDGGCGIESMIAIAKAIGLEVQGTYDRGRNPKRTGFIVCEPETETTEATP